MTNDEPRRRRAEHHLAAHYRFWAALSRGAARALAERDLIGPAVEAAGAARRFDRRARRVAGRPIQTRSTPSPRSVAGSQPQDRPR